MIVELTENIEQKDRQGNTVLSIPAGFKFDAIHPDYLTPELIEDMGHIAYKKALNREVFVFMFKGVWIIADAAHCYVPVSFGWRYNL